MQMADRLNFVIIEDDQVVGEEYARLLKQNDHDVTILNSSTDAVDKINEIRPDCVLCDLLLPGMDGLELFQRLRQNDDMYQPTFIIITGKQYEYDQRRALELGVDGYIIKPIIKETFAEELMKIIKRKMVIDFWGCRGTLTVPGKQTVIYGGHTNCITLMIANKHYLIFDAGTGIKALSNFLVKNNKLPINAKIFITHPHYDHICGIPFFAPLYQKGNQFEILGPNQHGHKLDKVIANQMDSVYFPVTMKEFASQITFRGLTEETFFIDDVKVESIYLNHPGRCLGYRVSINGKSFCYITDNELHLEDSPHYNQFQVDKLINFIKDASVLVIDTMYTDSEYKSKAGWGHSCVSRVIDIADKANVKLLCLHHHDPDQTDDDIDRKLEEANALLKARNSKTRCIAPHEGDKLVI